jgi:hypothetical protein
MTMTTDDMTPLVREITYLARTRIHRVSARQLAHPETMTPKSALALRDYLARQPVDPAVAAQVNEFEQRAWASQNAAVAGISPAAKAGGMPASGDLRPAAPARVQRVPEADRPAEAGFFLHEGRMYKVVRAIYGSGHLYAKRLDLDKGEWVIASGMVAYLREDERMTEAQAIEYSRKLEITPEMKIYGKCTLCGRALTDEESIRNRVGPGPHKGVAS